MLLRSSLDLVELKNFPAPVCFPPAEREASAAPLCRCGVLMPGDRCREGFCGPFLALLVHLSSDRARQNPLRMQLRWGLGDRVMSCAESPHGSYFRQCQKRLPSALFPPAGGAELPEHRGASRARRTLSGRLLGRAALHRSPPLRESQAMGDPGSCRWLRCRSWGCICAAKGIACARVRSVSESKGVWCPVAWQRPGLAAGH